MSAQLSGVPAEFNSASIVDLYDLTFDPGDQRNGSLYLCTPRRASASTPDEALALLRAAGLWSETPAKTVPDEQRQAYKDGLIFVAAIAYLAGVDHLVLARFDHPKFPSDTRRWEAWVDFFDARYERCR